MKTENHFGNGVSVCDRNRMKFGDYRVVAHIGYDRKVNYHAKALSDDAKIEIEDMAIYGNMAVSVSQPYAYALCPLPVNRSCLNF